MKILFVYPNIITTPKDISLGIAYLSSALKKAGHKTCIIDTTFGITEHEILQKATSFAPDLIAITSASNDFYYAKKIARFLKRLGIPIICGGYHPTVVPEEVIKEECFDAICIGEGEQALVEFVNELGKSKNNGLPTKVQNFWVKKREQDNIKIIKNPVRPLNRELDKLPFPDREIFDYKKYLDWHGNIASVISTRGCPFNCTYCINAFLRKNKIGGYVRFRSVDNIIEEIELMKKRYDIKAIEFYDDTFTLDLERIKEFAEKYPKRIDLPFYINARANTVSKEMFQLLKKAGCVRVSIGVESGSERIRNKIMKRNITEKQMIDAFSWAKQCGLQTYSFNIIGMPYETLSDIKATIRLNRILKPDFIGVSIFNAYPGTELYELCMEQDLLQKGKISSSYFTSTNVKLPNFTEKQLIRIRNFFGFNCFITYRPLRAFIDLADKWLASNSVYILLRSRLISLLKLKERL